MTSIKSKATGENRSGANREIIACDLTVFTEEERERHLATARALRGAVRGYMREGATVRLYFQGAVAAKDIEAWARQEARCCAFLNEARVTTGPDGAVLELSSSEAGARAWSEMFLSFDGDAAPGRAGGILPPSPWRGAAWIAGGLGLACVLPMFGAFFVARDMLPPEWNPGEPVYLAILALMSVGWFVWKFRGARRGKASGCGC